MSLIPQFYMDAIVSIGVPGFKGRTQWIGTGFLGYRKVDAKGNVAPFLVTNKHVILNKKEIVLRFKSNVDGALKEIPVNLEGDGKNTYRVHPNEKVDIAVLKLNGNYITRNNLQFDAFDIDEHAMTSSELRQEGVDEGSLIYMLGFPMGLVNANSKLPICRLGCVARMSKEQIDEQLNMLIDIQNFPGNSGSPIITKPEHTSIEGTKALSKAVLIGIVHSYIPYRENLINQQTGNVVEVRSENSGIALVHPVEQIREVVDLIQPKIKF